MPRKFIKTGILTQIINPPAHMPAFGIHDQWVSYSNYAEWVLPQGLSENQISRIASTQSGLQSLKLARWGSNTYILITFHFEGSREYYHSALNVHLNSVDKSQLLDNNRLMLCVNNREDLSHALSVLNERHQLDHETKDDLESSLNIKIAHTYLDAKIDLLQDRFDEVYADCLTSSSQHCYRVGHRARKHHGKQHPDWSVKVYLAARIEDEERFYFGYSYCYAIQSIAEMIVNGQTVDFDLFHHIDFETLFSTLTIPNNMFKSTHHDYLYYLGVCCREMHADNLSWAIRCFKGVPETDKNYRNACDVLLHFEMLNNNTADTPGSDLDIAESMLRYALAGIPENKWMAQQYFVHLSGEERMLPNFPCVDATVDSVVDLAKYMRNMNDENKKLRERVASMESELKKLKAEDAGVTVKSHKLF
jgi:hypothetical protein